MSLERLLRGRTMDSGPLSEAQKQSMKSGGHGARASRDSSSRCTREPNVHRVGHAGAHKPMRAHVDVVAEVNDPGTQPKPALEVAAGGLRVEAWSTAGTLSDSPE